MTYHEWRATFTGHLRAPNDQLPALVQGRDISRLLEAYYAEGFTPRRVANMFNKRYQKTKGISMQTNETKVLVIDSAHPMAGKVLTVAIIHAADRAVVAHNGDKVKYWLTAGQVEPVQIADDDRWLHVTGKIDFGIWEELKKAIEQIPDCRAGSGYSGGNGRMTVNVSGAGATAALPLVQAAVAAWGLTVKKQKLTLLGMEVKETENA